MRTCSSWSAVEIWSDGAGRYSGGAGVFITWHNGCPNSILSSPAGALSLSTAAEAVAALLAVSQVAREMSSTPLRLTIRLLFDSRALYARLQRPPASIDDSATRQTLLLLDALARQLYVSVMWVDMRASWEMSARTQSHACPRPWRSDGHLRQAAVRALDAEALATNRAVLSKRRMAAGSPTSRVCRGRERSSSSGFASIDGRAYDPPATVVARPTVRIVAIF